MNLKFVAVLFSLLGLFSTPCASASYLHNQEWKPVHTVQGIEVFSKKENNSKLLAFAGRGEIKASLKQILYALRRTELAPLWVPKLEERKLIGPASDIFGQSYNRFRMGFMMKDRDFVASHQLTSENGWFAVRSRKAPQHLHAPSSTAIRMEMNYADMFLKKISPKRTLVEFKSHADPKGWIPGFLINWVRKSFPVEYIRGLEDVAQKIPLDDMSYPGIDQMINAQLPQV